MSLVNLSVRLVRQYSRGGSGSSRRNGTGTVLRSKPGKALQAPPTSTKKTTSSKNNQSKESNQSFSFGHFSGLQQPTRQSRETSSKVIEKITNFEELRIFPSVRAAMKEEIKHGYNLKSTYIKDKEELALRPSPVQIAAIRKLTQPRLTKLKKQEELANGSNKILNELAKQNELNKLKVFTIAAETGSGKTWAYLAPLLSKLKEEEMQAFHRSKEEYAKYKKAAAVRSVILLPTHELVEQVYDTVNRAATIRINAQSNINQKLLQSPEYKEFLEQPDQQHALNLNVVKWGAGDAHTKLVEASKSGRIDVLVTTPSKLISLANINKMSNPFRMFSHVEYCVIDEADTLMDKSWLLDTSAVIKRFPKCKDLVFCSATIPREFNKTLEKMFPGEHSLINIVTPSLHKIPKKIHLKVIDAELSPYNGSKTRCLAQALYAIHKDGTEEGFVKRILIFVNEKKDVEPLAETLIKKYGQREQDIVGITGKDSPQQRLAKIEPFLQPAELLANDPNASKIKVLITTDLLARGLNFVGIKNVILMDLPNTSVDLVHRVGRTGRMRQSGRVFVIINKKTGKSWIKGLPKVIKKGIPLG
ncbi:ATP-dependent RNA helicase Mrh4p, mitochondrial [[Candida] anglica]|uniref:ATP-dependent RNA helicase n=1 Tax=[Candida] anglica TaxID=148631 RepID=A0ABP0EGF4_9ASCO